MTLKPEFLPVGSIVSKDNKPYVIKASDIQRLEFAPKTFNYECQPIPLTPEILTEWCNASEVKPNQYRIGERLFVIRDGKIFDYGSNTQLDYLHELQLIFLGFKTVLTVKIK